MWAEIVKRQILFFFFYDRYGACMASLAEKAGEFEPGICLSAPAEPNLRAKLIERSGPKSALRRFIPTWNQPK